MAKEERKAPANPEIKFEIANEQLNRNGWRLVVSGIDTTNFEKNPVCVVQHDDRMISIGRWKDLTKKEGTFSGTLLFDRNDDYAMSLYWKYVDGFMSAVSLNVRPTKESEAEEDLLPGQKYPTILECELLEISLVTIPAYGDAVKLSMIDGSEYKMCSIKVNNKNFSFMDKKDEKTVEQLTAELAAQRVMTASTLIDYHRHRGVVKDGEIEPLKKLAAADYESVKAMLEAREAPAAAQEPAQSADEAKAEALVALHIGRGAIAELERSVFKAAALADYEGAKKAMEARPGTADAKAFVEGMTQGATASSAANDRSNWSYLDFYKKDLTALNAMEKSEPERYKKLQASFEAECKAKGIVY